MRDLRTGTLLVVLTAAALLGVAERFADGREVRPWADGIEQGANALSELTRAPTSNAEEEGWPDSLFAAAVAVDLPHAVRLLAPGGDHHALSAAARGPHKVRGPPAQA